ncbi:MAG: SDR family oxidoreductase [Candidatus Omnitrophica bacterium]|nr:SDR family oxidoreductase [Candidatus Omnitrophota bacterium]
MNAIAPGVIKTDIWRKRFGKGSKKIIKEIESLIPLGRGIPRPDSSLITISKYFKMQEL